MDNRNMDTKAGLLSEKEEWSRRVAQSVSERSGIDLDTTLPCARWAAIWIDDLKQNLEDVQPNSQAGIREVLLESRDSSLAKCHDVPRYPSGALTLTSIVAAEQAFLMAYAHAPEEAEFIKELLEIKTSFD